MVKIKWGYLSLEILFLQEIVFLGPAPLVFYLFERIVFQLLLKTTHQKYKRIKPPLFAWYLVLHTHHLQEDFLCRDANHRPRTEDFTHPCFE